MKVTTLELGKSWTIVDVVIFIVIVLLNIVEGLILRSSLSYTLL